jgi:DNA helicase II / ATP-dependent DNA helicase PcrA
LKLPSDQMLSPEQKDIVLAGTNVETILITGPPGCGKTVVAILRLHALKRQEVMCTAVAYNNTLVDHSVVDGEQTMSSTYHKWLKNWWYKCSNHQIPMLDKYNFDYSSMLENLNGNPAQFAQNGDWGHLIIDEAQDFAIEAHQTLNAVRPLVFSDRSPAYRPKIFLLADENQRIQQNNNSRIEDLRASYLLAEEEEYKLKKNYRNTKEIAELAREFYVGLETGIPEIPKKRGEKPKLIKTNNFDEVIENIAKYVKLHETEEIGVLVYNTKTRKKICNALTRHFEHLELKLTVQTYPNPFVRGQKRTPLAFDKPRHVTVLCFGSSKGLEFDSVFMPELQTYPAEEATEAKMMLYTMISRARANLTLMITDPEEEAKIWNIIPFRSGLLEISFPLKFLDMTPIPRPVSNEAADTDAVKDVTQTEIIELLDLLIELKVSIDNGDVVRLQDISEEMHTIFTKMTLAPDSVKNSIKISDIAKKLKVLENGISAEIIDDAAEVSEALRKIFEKNGISVNSDFLSKVRKLDVEIGNGNITELNQVSGILEDLANQVTGDFFNNPEEIASKLRGLKDLLDGGMIDDIDKFSSKLKTQIIDKYS